MFRPGLALFVLLAAFRAPVHAQKPDFTREVRPILSQFCFKCHGPDEKTRKGDLRLDVREEAIKAAIVPGKPDNSELISRIHSNNDDEVMPPPSTKQKLSDTQKDILKRWIAAGAEYMAHWSFVGPKQPVVPKLKDERGVINPIDAFVRARLEKEGTQPSPEADRYTLIRRLSLDLIGLPPTPDEVDAFVKDPSTNAYEKLVDRLLASPHYGERWARRWLDLARYADTNGYEKDRPRIIWPYRDWVIQALNEDMPFDRFTIEQLAGDMLPERKASAIVATGFHRNTMLNEEGGIDPMEFRYYAVVDRANTTATTWLGLTLGCAQCHSHKYDPISQREYYQFLAYLNNADEPDYAIPDPVLLQRRAAIEQQITEKRRELVQAFPGGKEAFEKAFQKWLDDAGSKAVRWTVLRPAWMQANLAYLKIQEDGSILASGDQSKSDTYELGFDTRVPGVTAVRLEVLPHESLPDFGPGRTFYEGRKGDFFLNEIEFKQAGKLLRFKDASHDYANAAFGAQKVGAFYCYDGDPASGWATTDQPGRAHQAVFHLESPTDLTGQVTCKMLFERHYACSLGRFRISVTTATGAVRAVSHPAEIEDLLAKPAKERTAADLTRLREHFLDIAPELAKNRESIEQLRRSLPKLQTTMVLQERPAENLRITRIHHRGEYLQPTDPVQAGIIAALFPAKEPMPKNRLDFARWLVSPDNPLTARVTVNRQWQAFFGKGLVRTIEDFGLQGESPTHPELLDWLALDFIKQGWSMKMLHKRIVMSATYRQSAKVTPALLQKDPENRLLARGPRIRLEAEIIRDSVLRASGLLSPKLGGPSVFPPQPKSVTTEGTYGRLDWTPSQGEDRYRRSLYVFSKRTAPFAMFNTFDGPSGEACIARRDVSNTPLQALTLLNDIMFTEAAQAVGKRYTECQEPLEERLRDLFRQCLTRLPDAAEEAELLAFWKAQHEKFVAKKLDAKAVAGDGPGDVNERAAWTVLARVLFNLDEMITR